MKIAIFSDTFPPQTNGVANVVLRLTQNLTKRGHEVVVFTVIKNKEDHAAKNIKNASVFAIASVPIFAYSGERMALPSLALMQRLKDFNPDIIHTHTPLNVGWYASHAAKKLNIPLVGTHHTFYDHYLKHVYLDYDWAKKLSWDLTVAYYNNCNLVVNPTQALTDAMILNGLKSQSIVLPNSVDTALFSPAENEHTKNAIKNKFGITGTSVCYMGRISYEKSVDQVIRAFAVALKAKKDMRLMLIGDGPHRKNLESLANELGIASRVFFTGFLYGENLVEALRANDMFLTASKSENMPLSVLEAMATGLPIITVREKGLAEIVEDGFNGFFVKTDDPQDTAENILKLATNPELLKKISLGARLKALEYSHDRITEEIEKIYYQTINNYKKDK